MKKSLSKNPSAAKTGPVLAWLPILAYAAVSASPSFASDPLAAATISSGDTAAALPEVGRICQTLENADAGNFLGDNGKELSITNLKDEKCQGLNRRERQATHSPCQRPVSEILAAMPGSESKGKKLDLLCQEYQGQLNQNAAAYCALREIAKSGQALNYCKAYKAADKAQGGTLATLALDTAAAGICWAEALSMRKLALDYKAQENEWQVESQQILASGGTPAPFKYRAPPGAMGPGSIFNTGACGGAAMAAAVGELVQTSRVLLGKEKKSAGQFRVDADNNVDHRSHAAEVMEIALSSAGSLTGLRIGLCYYGASQFPGLCKGLNGYTELTDGKASKSALDQAKNNLKVLDRAEESQFTILNNTYMKGDFESCDPGKKQAANCMKQEYSKTDTAAKAAQQEVSKIYQAFLARSNLAQQAALIYTGLAAMRGVSLASAESTKQKSKEILQSMFLQNGNSPALVGSGVNSLQQSIYAGTGNAYSVPADSAITRQSAVSAGSPEAFLFPPGAPISTSAERLANQIPRKRLEEAARGGAAGLGGVISGAAQASGAKSGLDEVRASTQTIFANLPRETGGSYSASGGGGPVASTGGGGGGDLNLKSLFGGTEGDSRAASGTTPELAYREPASEDIWHSQNPKGHNLFQIVSDKYDSVQRKSAVGPEL